MSYPPCEGLVVARKGTDPYPYFPPRSFRLSMPINTKAGVEPYVPTEGSSRYNQGPYELCWQPEDVVGDDELAMPPGDQHWHAAHGELRELHVEKSSTYGNDADPLANFTESAQILGKPAEYAVLVRILDKVARAVHMIDAGRATDVKEYPDIASLALCAEALLQRRLHFDPDKLEISPGTKWKERRRTE